jgi:hypothetical protein
VAAVVLDDEDTHQQGTGRQRQRHDEPIGDRVDQIHRGAGGEERAERRQELERSLLSDRPGKGHGGLSDPAVGRPARVHAKSFVP